MDSKSQTPSTNVTTPSIFGDKHQIEFGQMPDQLPLPTDQEKVNTDVDMEDPYKARMIAGRKIRPVSLISPFTNGLSVALAIVLMCLGLRALPIDTLRCEDADETGSLFIRYMYDKDPIRFALVAVLPPMIFMCAFPCSVLVSSLVRAPRFQSELISSYPSLVRSLSITPTRRFIAPFPRLETKSLT